MRSAMWSSTLSTRVPSTSGSHQRPPCMPWRSSRHERRWRAWWRASASAAVTRWVRCTMRCRSAGDNRGPRVGPLAIGVGGGDLDQWLELIPRQRAVVHRRRDLGHRLQLPGNFDRRAGGARRHRRIGHRVERVALVEHQRRRQLPQTPPLTLAARGLHRRAQRLVRTAAHLIDQRVVVEPGLGLGLDQRQRQRAHDCHSTRGV